LGLIFIRAQLGLCRADVVPLGLAAHPQPLAIQGSMPEVTATEDRKEHKETFPIPASQI
jgi:hypothetical protein